MANINNKISSVANSVMWRLVFLLSFAVLSKLCCRSGMGIQFYFFRQNLEKYETSNKRLLHSIIAREAHIRVLETVSEYFLSSIKFILEYINNCLAKS